MLPPADCCGNCGSRCRCCHRGGAAILCGVPGQSGRHAVGGRHPAEAGEALLQSKLCSFGRQCHLMPEFFDACLRTRRAVISTSHRQSREHLQMKQPPDRTRAHYAAGQDPERTAPDRDCLQPLRRQQQQVRQHDGPSSHRQMGGHHKGAKFACLLKAACRRYMIENSPRS